MTESTPSSTTTAQPIAAGKSTAYSLLRRDVRFLGNILGEVLVHQSGKELLEIVEQIRESSKSLRAQFDNNQVEQFQEQIHKLDPAMRHQVIRAFAIYFQLVNIAEQNHRIRRKRDYERSAGETVQPGSIEDTIQGLKQEGLTPDEVQDLIKGITLELVMTAHPTEATRRVILDIHRRIAQDMMELDNPNLTHRERELLKSRLTNEVLTLWQTDEIRPRKPTVIDEVKNGLYYFDETLFTVLPDVYFELERCLVKFYPDTKWHVPTFLKFGSWIGGDRDGNPSVTSEVTWETLMMHRQLVLRKYEESLRELKKQLSFSTTLIQVTPELMQSIEKDRRLVSLKQDDLWRNANEPYRIKLTYMIEKMVHTRAATGGNPLDETIYRSPEELLQDLRIMDRSLRSHYAESVANETVARMIRQVELFGFHLMALDVRQHSKEHEAAMAEILTKMGFTDQYPSLPEASKIELLHQLLNDPRPLTSSYLSYSESTEECLNVFRTIKKAQAVMGTSCISSYLISMTQGASDMLEVMVLAKEAGLFRKETNGTVTITLQSVPLFETIDDLHAAPGIMRTLFELPVYLEAVRQFGNLHEIMLGYSDSNKDGGVVTANWELRVALNTITKAAQDYGVKLKFFHGRGGALGRGGMPLNRSILAQPPHTIGAGIKITEQGEVLSSRYSLQGIAYRSLEQATSALITAASLRRKATVSQDEPDWERIVADISERAQRKYQDLIFRDPDFLGFFKQATPLAEIGELNIGSRPSKRKNSDRFEDLRAIPWVFSWTQSRYLLPAWYAAGTGLQSYYNGDPAKLDTLRSMYDNWSFFKGLIDNLQMALAKADLLIAGQYAGLAEDRQAADRIFTEISEEFDLTRELILHITGQQDILDHIPVIQESIRLRNPYVDPLSYMQVQLLSELRELREKDEDSASLLREVLLTINGIAAGLRNTG